MPEADKIKGDLMQKAYEKVMEDAKVPMHHHLKVLKEFHETLKQGSEERKRHEEVIKAHEKQMVDHETRSSRGLEILKSHAEEALKRYKAFDAEVARVKQIKKGESGYTPQKGVDYFDAEAPSLDEILTAVIPHIPPPIKGDKGEDAPKSEEIVKEVVKHIQKNKSLDMSHIRNAQGFIKDGVKYKFEELMHGAGKASSGGSGFQAPTSGAVNGVNATFVWATAPNVIVVDQGRAMQKISSDGTVNWTGTTTTVLTIAPTFDIYATS